MSNNKYEINFITIEVIINNKIHEFIKKHIEYPQYLKIPLSISNCMKQKMGEIEGYNIDYSTGLLKYKGLILCETIAIEKPEEIEVF